MENFNLKYQEKEGSKLKLGSQYRNYWRKLLYQKQVIKVNLKYLS